MPKKIQDDINKKIENEYISQYSGELNFAFCPSCPIKISKKLMLESEEVKSIIKDYPYLNIDEVLEAFRYFYICYSIKIDNIDQKNKDYFYFQLFSQFGREQVAVLPIYGFYSNEEIVSMIKDIDDFAIQKHDRQIFETYEDELYGPINDIIALMQDWTSLKLLHFGDLYFKDESTVNSLYKLIKQQEINETINKKNKPRKISKIKEKQPVKRNKKNTKSQ